MVYQLFKPCWLTHVICTCFKETALLFNVHLSCFVNFILCPTDKCMFKVNKLVLVTVVTLSTAKTTCVAKGEGGGERTPPPSRHKQVQLALNRKNAFFMLCLKTTGLKSCSFHYFYLQGQYHNMYNIWFLKVAQLVAQVFKQLIE